MPKYNYRCKNCEDVFETVHSMSERLTDCKKCDTLETLVKIPTNIAVQYCNINTGKVVDDYIKETREEVEKEKELLRTREYES